MKKLILNLILGTFFINLLSCKKQDNNQMAPINSEPKYKCVCYYETHMYNPVLGTGTVWYDTIIMNNSTKSECELKSSTVHTYIESRYKDCQTIY